MGAYVWPVDAVTGAPSYTGRMLRQMLAVLMGGGAGTRPLAGRTGVAPRTPSTTVTATSTTWTVLPHGGYIDAETAAQSAGYFYTFDSNQTGSVTAANATNPRIDLISVRIDDPAEGDGTSVPAVAVVYTAGTAAASPTVPATPARSMALAQINVPTSGGGSPSVTWVAPYLIAAGGIIRAADSSQYPFGAYIGQFIDDATLGLMRWDGTAWQKFGLGGDTGWLTLPVGASYDSASTAQMRLKAGTVRMRKLVQLDSGANFPTSSDTVVISTGGLPSAFQPSSQVNQILSGPNVGQSVRVIVNSDGSMHFVTQASTGAYVDVSGCRYDVD
jgi:hypothetical protein